jgi:hypothetical protein
MLRNKVYTIAFVLAVFLSCDNSTDPSYLSNKLYISVKDENRNGLMDAGLHFYLDYFNLNSVPQNSPSNFKKFITADSVILPLEYRLYQNFPNPFNPVTNISFALPESGAIVLQILNREDSTIVKNLLSGNYQAGFYQVIWDGTNDYGEYVTNNVYYYQLSSNEFRDTKRLFIDMADPEHIRSLNCIPLAKSNPEGKIEIDYSVFPINEKIIWTDEAGNEIGTFNIPESLNLVLIKDGYNSEIISVKMDPQRPLDLSVELKKN